MIGSRRSACWWSLLVLVASLIVACGRSSGPESGTAPGSSEEDQRALATDSAKVTVVSLAIAPSASSLPASVSLQLKATALYSNQTKRALTTGASWSVSDPTVANVSTTGLATALKPGAVQITVTDTAVNLSATASLTVTSATLASVAVTPANNKLPGLGTTATFTATGTFSDGSHFPLRSGIAWASTNGSIAMVSSTGVATTVGAGTVAISATSTATGLRGKTTLTVGTATLSSIAITPTRSRIPAGLTEALVAMGTYSDGSTLDLTNAATWSSSNPSVATLSNDPETQGVATAIGAGGTTITAAIGAKKGRTTLSVTTAAFLTAIAVTPAGKSVPLGTTLQLAATGTYSDQTSHDITDVVTWGSSSSTLSVSNAGGSSGLATALAGPTGVATVTATLGALSGTDAITVTSAVLTSIQVSPSSASVPAGLPQAFTALGTYSDSSTADLTTAVTWSTGSVSIATISNAASPAAGTASTVAVGMTTITAYDPTTGVTGSATLTVTAASLVSIAINPASAVVPIGVAQPFSAVGTYSDHTQMDLTALVTWSVLDPGLATISNASGTQGLASAEAIGSNTIQALDPTTGLTSTATLQVTPEVSIAVTPAEPTVRICSYVQFDAVASYTNSSPQDVTSTSTWSTPDPSLLNVSNGENDPIGSAYTTALGTATITATDKSTNLSGSTSIKVTPSTCTSPNCISPSCPIATAGGASGGIYRGNVGDTLQLDASGSIDPQGAPLTFAWDTGSNTFSDGVGPTISKTYSAPGDYRVAVQVMDHPATGASCATIGYATVVIAGCDGGTCGPPPCPYPSAGGGPSRTYCAFINSPVQFDATDSQDADGNPLTYGWDFYNENAFNDSTLARPAHTWTSAGTYTVALQVTNHPPTGQSCTTRAYATVTTVAAY